MTPTHVVAVDFGATSVRVCRIDLSARPISIDVVHRHDHRPVADERGVLRWDWTTLVGAMYTGLQRAVQAGPVVSIGVDTWGVDYGLLDESGRLFEPPISYRDPRTNDFRRTVESIGEERLYSISGLQLLPFNTVFQLAAHPPSSLRRAQHLLMLPELLAYELTGRIVAERTSAGTTGLLDLTTGTWSSELCAAIDLPPSLLPAIAEPGTRVGYWRDIPVHLVGGHDTASAVMAGGSSDSAYVSTGTWLLVGCEREAPDLSSRARRAGLTNEQGAAGGIRLLRNVAGWWLVEECRRRWGHPPIGELLATAAALTTPVPIFDATDERFLAPHNMPFEICDAAGMVSDSSPGMVTRCAVESMAATSAEIISILGIEPADIRIFGGGVRSQLFNRLLSERSGVPVIPGVVEATALGNALSQGIALGVFSGVDDAREACRTD